MKYEELLANYSCLFPRKMIETKQNRMTQLITDCVTFTYRSLNALAYSNVYNEQFQSVASLGSYFIKQSKKNGSFNHTDHSFTIWRVNVL